MKKYNKIVKSAPKHTPIYIYTSKCCTEQANKPALVKTESDKDKKDNIQGLGKWTCSKCRKKCIVARSKTSNQKEQENKSITNI